MLAALVAAGALSAQATTTNIFHIQPGSDDATTRSGVPGPSVGDVLVEVRGVSYENPANLNGATGADYVSVGDLGNTPPVPSTGDGRVNGFDVVIQDQNSSTTEFFDFCLVTEASAAGALGNPAPPPAGNAFGPEVILRTATLPTPPRGTGGLTLAWIITATLGTPANVIPSGLRELTAGRGNASWYYGVGLQPNPAWTTDGASIHMASFDGLGLPFPNLGDNPRDGVVSMAQSRDVTNGVVLAKSTTSRTMLISILTEASLFQHGANIAVPAQIGPNPNFAVAGSYPDSCGSGNTGRILAFPPYPGRAGVGDGYGFRVRSGANIGVPVTLGLGAGVPGAPGSISGFSGLQVYLNFFNGAFVSSFTSIWIPVGAIGATGELALALLPPSAAKPLCLPVPGNMSGQAAILAPAALTFTNGASAHF
jgi:hypothetical protein